MHPGWLRNPEGEGKIKRDSRLYFTQIETECETRHGKTLKSIAATRNGRKDAANTNVAATASDRGIRSNSSRIRPTP